MTQPRKIVCLITGLALAAALVVSAADQKPPQAGYGNSLGVSPGQPVPGMVMSSLLPEIAIGDDPALGKPDAPVTIVEFIDYECPFCQGFAKDTYPQLKANYIDTGKLRYVARDFPLAKHTRARPAADAAACAREQGRFWEMHDALLTAGEPLTDKTIESLAGSVNVDLPKFDVCRAEQRHSSRLDADFTAARALGVSGTPSFLVGPTSGDIAKGRLLQGDKDYAGFEKAIAAYLER